MREPLSLIKEFLEDPFLSLKGLKEVKKIIGITPADVPEEVIHAAGLHPFMILGTTAPIRKVTALIPDNACSLARSNLELVLSYQRDFFDGFVIPQVDDTTQHLSDLWERRFRDRFFHKFMPPRQLTRPSARFWLKKEVERLIKALEDHFGGDVKGSMSSSIALFNRNRALLKELYERKRKNPGILSNRDFFDIAKAALMMDKAEHSRLLEEILSRLRSSKNKDGHWIPVALAGITVEPPEIFDYLDQTGLNVVADNLITASRYIYGEVPKMQDPVEALLQRHFSRPNFTPIHDGPERVVDDLVRMVEESGAKGLIFVHIQYCESQDFDLPDIRKRFREEGIPFLVITTEYQTKYPEQIRTRLEAFRNMLEGEGL